MDSIRKSTIETLQRGGVIVASSDTVYGLMCSALSEKAVKRLFTVKNRTNKPGTILFANKKQLLDVGFDSSLINKAMQYWPGPVSVVIPAPDSLAYLHKGLQSLAIRVPADVELRKLLGKTGPLATTSANMPSEPTVTTIDEAKKIFGDKVDLYVDGGEIKNVKPSKIVKINNDGTTKTLRD